MTAGLHPWATKTRPLSDIRELTEPSLDIARISVDLISLKEMTGSKKSVFLNLATELIDSENPPPYNMVENQDQISLDPFGISCPQLRISHSKSAAGCWSSAISVKACENSTCALYHSSHPGSIYRYCQARYSRLERSRRPHNSSPDLRSRASSWTRHC